MLLAGQIGKPHGIAGEVYVVRISDDPKRFDARVVLHHEDGRDLIVETARVHRDRFLVKFEGIATRSDAELLRGNLYVPPSEARELDADEYWPRDLIGCVVVDVTGNSVGTVEDVITSPAQDLLQVATDDGMRLVPMVKQIVTVVDTDARSITIDPPAGLLE